MKKLETCFACEGRAGLMFMFPDGAHSVPCRVCEGRGVIGDGFMKQPVIYDKNRADFKPSQSMFRKDHPTLSPEGRDPADRSACPSKETTKER